MSKAEQFSITIGNFEISWQLIIITISLLVSILSMINSKRALKYSIEIRKKDHTRKQIDFFNSSNFQNKIKWIKINLEQYISDNNIHENCGLSFLNKFSKVKINIDSKLTNMESGEVCKEVLTFFNKISKDIKSNDLIVEDILEEMMISMKDTWFLLYPILIHHPDGGYYRFFRKKYSLGSLVESIKFEKNVRTAAWIISNRWKIGSKK